MKLSQNLINYIVEEADRVHHGRVIIEINATSDKIDVVTESRERFPNRKIEPLAPPLLSEEELESRR
jgi:hypothetical protein